MKRNSIRYFLASRIIPFLMVFLVFSSASLLFMAKIIVENNLKNSHDLTVIKFKNNINKNIENLKQQVKNIANNDLIINSLIDSEGRENYIPLFIRSLKLTGINTAHISIRNFEGDITVVNDISEMIETDPKSPWKVIVLEKGESYSKLGPEGLVLIEPIKFSSYPEGAIYVDISLQELQNIFGYFETKDILVYSNPNNKVLFSSDPSIVPISNALNDGMLSEMYVYKKTLENGYSIISAESHDNAYDGLYFLIWFILVAIAVTVMGTVITILMSSKLIAKTLSKFVNALGVEKEQGINIDMASDGLPRELVDINHKFLVLVDDLNETQSLKQNIQSILNSLNEYLVVFDTHGNTQKCNYTFEQLIKLIDNEGKNDFEKIMQLDDCYLALDTDKHLEDFEIEYRLNFGDSNKKNSDTYIIKWTRSLYYNEDGVLEGIIFVGANVTHAKEIERDLRLKNRTIEEASNAIVIADAKQADMPIIYVNKSFINMTGYSFKESVGRNCRYLQGDNTDPETIARVRDAIKNNESIVETILNYRKDGTEFYNELSVTPVTDENQEVTHFLGVQVDVTERVKTGQFLVEAKKKAEESAQLKSEFLASMSHEIRTPMNGVLGMLGLLKRTSLNDQQDHYTNLAHSSAKSLLSLINDILDFSKVEAGKLELELIDFNVNDMLSDFTEAMAQRAQEKHIELMLDTSGIHHVMVQGDPGRIRQILTNLVGNAIKFTEGGEILITVEQGEISNGEMSLSCSVRDTGIGIPEEKLPTLFESFAQVDASTTRKFGGTGLGLAIVKQLCELMGGDVSVSSDLGVGSVFSFKILLKYCEKLTKTVPDVDIEGVRILIVDDNPTNQYILKSQLNYWGAEVVEESSGDGALKRLSCEQECLFDIAILDMVMPGMNGEELGRRIRSDDRYDSMHLVMMTSMSQRGDAKRLADLGFSAFFPKPTTPRDLRTALNVLVDNGEALASASPLLTRHTLREIEFEEASSQLGSELIHHNEDEVQQSNARILLVEDNVINQQVALGVLENLGYSADLANNGIEAISCLSNIPIEASYDLIFMDCQMPEMDGYDTTRAIRKGKVPNPNIPIIAMTANAMKGDKEQCIAAGMDDYLTKPIDPTQINACLQRWLGDIPLIKQSNQEAETMSNANDEVWDQENFMKRILNNEAIAVRLIDLFKSDTPQTIEKLEEAIKRNQAEEAGLLAHKLKGSVGNLGGIILSDIVFKIEQAGKSGDIEEIKTLWPEVIPEYERLVNAIDSRS